MKLVLLLPLFFAACTSAQVNRVAETTASTPVPERTPDEIVSGGIDRVSKLAGLSPLKSAKLANGDTEVRVWYGFGLILLEGFVIKRNNNQWTAFHLKADSHNPRYTTRVARIQLPAPKSDWGKCWERLVDAGILTLPNGIEGPDPDAEGFYVETRANGSYRNYEYDSPEYSESPNAKRMLAVGEIIADEFGLPRFHVTRRSQ